MRLFKQIIYFITIIVLLAGSTIFVVLPDIKIIFKIFVPLLAVVLSVLLFLLATKQRIEPQNEDEVTEENKEEQKEEKQNDYQVGHQRCPKCHKPFDGMTCFNCGYKKEQ